MARLALVGPARSPRGTPAAALCYQIVILFMVAAANAPGLVSVVLLAYLGLTSRDQELRLERLRQVA